MTPAFSCEFFEARFVELLVPCAVSYELSFLIYEMGLMISQKVVVRDSLQLHTTSRGDSISKLCIPVLGTS